MKKIISAILSLTMMLCVFSSVNVFAEDFASTDVSTTAASLFAEWVGNDFDENYFFLATFDPKEFQTDKGYTDADMKIEVSTESEVELTLKIAQVSLKYNAVSPLTNSSNNDCSTIKVKKDNPVTVDYWKLMGTFIEDDGTACFGLALANSEDLTADAKVTVKLTGKPYIGINSQEEETIGFGTIEHTFVGPVKFSNENLDGFGKLLTKLKFGNPVSADDVALALNGAANLTDDTDKEALSMALKADYVDIAVIAETIKGKSNVTVKDTTFDGLTVSMPYAGLAGAVGEDAKVYAPVVSAGVLPESKEEGKEYYALDISLGVNGEAMATAPIIPQKVVVDLPSTFDKSVNSIIVIHGSETLNDVTVANGKAEFFVNSFSNFVLVGTPVTYNEVQDEHAEEAALKITMDDSESNVFTLALTPYNNGSIIKYATGGYKVVFKAADISSTEEDSMKNFTYELIPANGITITNETSVTPGTGELQAFTFVASATDRVNLVTTGTEALPIAKIVVKGTGDFSILTFGLENENTEISQKFYMEKFDDNDSVKGTVMQSDGTFTIKEKKFDIDFNIDFNLHLQADPAGTYKNKADYLNIVVELKNEITGDIYTLMVGEGTDGNVTYLPVTYNSESSKATGSITLPANATYSYKIKGLGFRTFRGSVYLDEDKTINLWNNALTSDSVNVVADDDSTAKKVTFLVGDIYEDGIVDIYDLSAVTSYFGSTNIDAANENVFACDLDRDGQISVQDIAWVQMSYGN